MPALLIEDEDVDLNGLAACKPLHELRPGVVSSAVRELLRDIYGHAVRAVSVPQLADGCWVGTCQIDGEPRRWRVTG
jgi:hypothetical protein